MKSIWVGCAFGVTWTMRFSRHSPNKDLQHRPDHRLRPLLVLGAFRLQLWNFCKVGFGTLLSGPWSSSCPPSVSSRRPVTAWKLFFFSPLQTFAEPPPQMGGLSDNRLALQGPCGGLKGNGRTKTSDTVKQSSLHASTAQKSWGLSGFQWVRWGPAQMGCIHLKSENTLKIRGSTLCNTSTVILDWGILFKNNNNKKATRVKTG